MPIRPLLRFTMAFALSIGFLAMTTGVYFTEADRPTVRHAADDTPTVTSTERMWVGRPGANSPNTQVSPHDHLTGVGLPIIDKVTGIAKGRLACASVRYVPELDRMRLERPVVEMWELDRATGRVDRTSTTRLEAAEMLVDREYRVAVMQGGVVVTRDYQGSTPRLRTERLLYWIDDHQFATDQPVEMEWGRDLVLKGIGMDGSDKLEEVEFRRDGRAEMLQQGAQIVTPLAPAREGALAVVKVVARCTGPLRARRVPSPIKTRASRTELVLVDQARLERERATLTTDRLLLLLKMRSEDPSRAAAPPKDPKAPGAPPAEPANELERMEAVGRVAIDDPDQGQAWGDRFVLIERAKSQQWMELAGNPKVRTRRTTVDPKAPDAPPKVELIDISARGPMEFVRQIGATRAGPDVARMRQDVALVRRLDGPNAPAATTVDCQALTVEMVPEPRLNGKGTRMALANAVAEERVAIKDATVETRGARCAWTRLEGGMESMIVTGDPRLIAHGIEDDQVSGLGGAAAGPPATPRKIDLEVCSDGPLATIGNSAERDAGRTVKFRDRVRVRRYALDPAGARVSTEPLPSMLDADELDLELASPAPGASMALAKMDARGKVALADEGGTARSGTLAYTKATGALLLTRAVVLADSDGGEYHGDSLEYAQEGKDTVLRGTDAEAALARIPAGAAAGGAKTFHEVRAPVIVFRRAESFIHARTEKPFQKVKSVFAPSEKGEDFLPMGGGEGAEKRPWRLDCRDMQVWLEETVVNGKPGPKRMRKLVADGMGDRIQMTKVVPPDQDSERQEAFGAKLVSERNGERITSVLSGDAKERAKIESAREILWSRAIEFDHADRLARCPTGGNAEFLEEAETKPGAPPAKPSKVRIRCDGPILYRADKSARFERAVEVVRESDASRITGDALDCELDGATRRMKKAVATGETVRVQSGKDVATGNYMVWEAETGKMVLTATAPRLVDLNRAGERFRAPVVVFDRQTGRVETPKGLEKLR